MSAEIAPYFLIYAALFRIAIIAAGVVSIVLGYRLFYKENWVDAPTKGTSVETTILGSSFKFRNAAPGSLFALFGVIIIILMLYKGAPELTLEMIMPTPTNSENTSTVTTKITMRGNETAEVSAQKCLDEYGKGKVDDAIEACRQAIIPSIKSMDTLAWIYQKQGKFKEAFPLAKMAVMMNPQETDYVKTLGTILCQVKNDETLQWMEKTIEQAPNYKVFSKELNEYKEDRCD